MFTYILYLLLIVCMIAPFTGYSKKSSKLHGFNDNDNSLKLDNHYNNNNSISKNNNDNIHNVSLQFHHLPR